MGGSNYSLCLVLVWPFQLCCGATAAGPASEASAGAHLARVDRPAPEASAGASAHWARVDRPAPEASAGARAHLARVDRPAPEEPPRELGRAPLAGNELESDFASAALDYPLDPFSRKAPLRGELACPDIETVRYRGEIVPFQKPLEVYVGFVDHLRRFESIVSDTAIEIYGRPPAKIFHYGPNRCRRIRMWPFLLSEHSLGNAIDVGGFVFDRIGEARSELPRQLHSSFTVNLSLHWASRSELGEIHSRFLQTLAKRIIESEGLFRTILGPAHRNHKGHFHLDMAPRDNVVVF